MPTFKTFNLADYMPSKEGEEIIAMIQLVPHANNRLDLQIFTYEPDEAGMHDSWEPFGDAVTVLNDVEIPCTEANPLAFVDYQNRLAPARTDFNVYKMLYDLNLGQEVLTYGEAASKNHGSLASIFRLNLDELSKYDDEGVQRFITASRAELIKVKPEVRSNLLYSEMFEMMGQVNKTDNFISVNHCGDMIFKTPYTIEGKAVYLQAGQDAVESPNDPYNFMLFTTDETEEEIEQYFTGVPVGNNLGCKAVPRGAAEFIPASFKYSDATRGAEYHSQFDKIIMDSLTKRPISKEDVTKECMDFVRSYYFELHVKEDDMSKELEYEHQSDKEVPELKPEIPDFIHESETYPWIEPEPDYEPELW